MSTEAKRKYYLRNKELVKKRTAQWKKENRERVSLLCRDYYERNKESIKEKAREYRRKNRIQKSYDSKRAAHSKVAYALKTGVLVREPCEVCGRSKTEAHHDDYSKPFSVRWLCKVHHTELHRLEGTYAKEYV